MNINQKLDEILLNHGMILETSCGRAVRAVRNMEEKFLSGCKIGLYGVGIEAEGRCIMGNMPWKETLEPPLLPCIPVTSWAS